MKEKKKVTKKMKISKMLRKVAFIGGYVIALNVVQASNVFAANDPLSVINNLSTFIFGIIRAIGMILLGWGIVQVGLALKSHDASQRAKILNLMRDANVLIITFAKEILDLITGG